MTRKGRTVPAMLLSAALGALCLSASKLLFRRYWNISYQQTTVRPLASVQIVVPFGPVMMVGLPLPGSR